MVRRRYVQSGPCEDDETVVGDSRDMLVTEDIHHYINGRLRHLSFDADPLIQLLVQITFIRTAVDHGNGSFLDQILTIDQTANLVAILKFFKCQIIWLLSLFDFTCKRYEPTLSYRI